MDFNPFEILALEYVTFGSIHLKAPGDTSFRPAAAGATVDLFDLTFEE